MTVAAGSDGGDGRRGELVAGKYRLGRRVGVGGMGEVYEARHTVIGRRFAVKVLLPEYARKPDMLDRFRREAQAAGALESEHVAAVTDLGVTADGAPYLLMEFLEGEDLRRLLARTGPLDVTRAVDLAIQACRGLEVAHRGGIVHRDLKPENLFVIPRSDGGERLKILDFGIAKLRDAASAPDEPAGGARSAATRSGLALGTPCYMSPEQARGERLIDHRSDIYSLGVILYELLSGTRPHDGASYNAILFHILSQRPAPLARLRPDLPADVTAIVARAMAFDARNRYAGAADLSAALAPFAGLERAGAVPRGAAVRAPATAATVPAPPSGEGPAAVTPARVRRARRRARAWRLTAAAVAAATLAIGVAVVSAGRTTGRQPAAAAAAPGPAPAPTPAPTSVASTPAAATASPVPPRPAPAATPTAVTARSLAVQRALRALGARATAAPPAGARARVPSSGAALRFDGRNPYDD